MKMNLFAILIIFSGFGIARAEEESAGFRAGPNMAVQEASLKNGFRLATKALEVIGVKTTKLGARPYSINRKSLVYYGDKVGVYRLRDGWFKLIEVKVEKKSTSSQFIMDAQDLSPSDEVATDGVALLRVSEMDAFGGEE